MTEREDFEALVRRCQTAVCAVAYARLRDRGRSEEIAQEAFLLAWLRREHRVGWICGIARNLARNASRRDQGVPMTSEPAATTRDPRDELIERENEVQATDALARLPERYREAVVLYYRGDESFAEVAAALGISEVAARQRVHRGREKLRAALVPVESALRSTRPGAAFTAAVLAAWLVRGRTAAAAGVGGAASATLGTKALLVAIVASGALVIGTIAVVATGTRSHADEHVISGVIGRFPAMAGAHSPPRHFLVATPALPAPVVTTNPTMDITFKQIATADLMKLAADTLEIPIWIDPSVEEDHIDIAGSRLDPVDVIDNAADRSHAIRTEVAAIRLVAFGGQTDAASLGGDPISIDVRDAPLDGVLGMIDGPLHMPIGRLALDLGDDDSAIEQPKVTLSVHDVTAGAALQQVLTQAHLGYELTTGFAITPRAR